MRARLALNTSRREIGGSQIEKKFPIFPETLPIFFLCKGTNPKEGKLMKNRTLPVKTPRIRWENVSKGVGT
jgi:hypothetical protein